MVTSRHWNRKLLVRERCQAIDSWLEQVKAGGANMGEALAELTLADLRKLKTFHGERVPVRSKAQAIALLLQPHLYGGIGVVEVLPLEAPEGQPTPRPPAQREQGARAPEATKAGQPLANSQERTSGAPSSLQGHVQPVSIQDSTTDLVCSKAQVYLLLSLATRGWEATPSMVSVLLDRCSATTEELAALVDAGLVGRKLGRFQLTEAGHRHFKAIRGSHNI